ncbi:hypothetical protein [Schnuerera ultunensis]|uniref:hypothetical protein n=1 Tax=Schnuerera ultunensis TaxID=45497 RepID=UPI00034866B3|nr:hypothetical protein [Schnuerera ultunensis]
MEKKIKLHNNKRNILSVLIIILLLVGCVLWYRELGTNREVPKRAKLVSNFLIKGDSYR